MSTSLLTAWLVLSCAPASAQTVIDTQEAAASLRVDLTSLERPGPGPRGAADLGSLVPAPASVWMSPDTVDVEPVAPAAEVVSRAVRPSTPQTCTISVDVDATGRALHVEATSCDGARPSVIAAVHRAIARWRFEPARLAGQPVGVSGLNLTVALAHPKGPR